MGGPASWRILANSGAVTLDDRPLARWPWRGLARSVTYLTQEARRSWAMAVRRIVTLGALTGPYLDHTNI